MSTIKLGIFGITGRMGKAIQELAPCFPSIQIIGGTSRSDSFSTCDRIANQADVLVDFSHPMCLEDNLQACLKAHKPFLIGTTGLEDYHYHLIEQASKTIPLIYASNTSIGIALIQHLVTIAAQHLDTSYDIEVFETHHRHKKDAPSGTALSLGNAAAQGRHISHTPFIRQSGQRREGEIGYASHRGGGVFGEHTVRFLGDEEIIEIKHTSLSRHLFARGALKIAIRLVSCPSGLYTIGELFS